MFAINLNMTKTSTVIMNIKKVIIILSSSSLIYIFLINKNLGFEKIDELKKYF